PGVGLNALNYHTLRDLAGRLREHGCPHVVGGDFNVTKSELEKRGVLRHFEGRVVDALEATRVQVQRSVDMSIVSQALEVIGIQVVSGSPVYPHRPVLLNLKATRQPPWIRPFDVPKPFPQARPAGCLREDPAPRWRSVRDRLAQVLDVIPDIIA
ncbi:unnamed protein product, partial [Prorocentrum cordatum]